MLPSETIVEFGTKESPSIKDGLDTLAFVVCISWMERLSKSNVPRMDLEVIILSEVSQKEKDKYM